MVAAELYDDVIEEFAQNERIAVPPILFDSSYYAEKNGLAFASAAEALHHFARQGLFAKLDAAPLVSTEFILYWAHLNGQPVQSARQFFDLLASLPAEGEIGWSARMIPSWIMLQYPEPPLEPGASVLNLMGLRLPAGQFSPHPGLLPIAQRTDSETVGDVIANLDGDVIEGASLVDIGRYSSQHKDLGKAGMAADALFDHIWCYGLRQNRLSYLGNKAPRKMHHLQLLRTALTTVFRSAIDGRVVEGDLPQTRLPEGKVYFHRGTNDGIQDVLGYDPASDRQPPPLEAFHEMLPIVMDDSLLVLHGLGREITAPAVQRTTALLDKDLLEPGRADATRRVVYSINLGLYDDMPVPPELDDCAYYIITDARAVPSNLPWRIVRPTLAERDRKRLCLWYKTHPHLLFPQAEHSVWIDSNLQCLSGSEKVIAAHEALSEIATFQHPDRNCVYDEGKAVEQLGLDQPQKIRDMVAKIKAAGMPANFGLFETNVLYSKPGDYRVRAFFDTWWREIFFGSRRDQMSFTFAAFLAGIEVARLDNSRCAKDSRFFRKRPHRDMQERTV